MMIEIEGILEAGHCPYSYPHSWCDNPCQIPPEPLELSDRPEEAVQERVFRAQNVPYTRPERLGVAYHDRKPDYYFYIDGLGWLSLETKNRKPGSWQGPS